MSYSRQFNRAGVAANLASVQNGQMTRINRSLDFSPSQLPLLNESSLTETVDLRGPAGQRVLYGVQGQAMVAPTSGAVDWNGNGSIGATAVMSDINFISALVDCPVSPGQMLAAYSDWPNLIYTFRISPGFAEG